MEGSERRERGKQGEKIASQYLLKKGYSIIRKNYRSFSGEIDIIAFDEAQRILVFIEVRFRSGNFQVDPLESVDYRKQEKIKKTALKFLSETKIPYDSVRFDVVGIVERDGRFEIEHVKDAF